MSNPYKALFYDKGTFSPSLMWMNIAYSAWTYRICTRDVSWQEMGLYAGIVGTSRVAIYLIKKHYNVSNDALDSNITNS